MVILALPLGVAYGWGNCGRWLTRELARITPVHLLPIRMTPESAIHELEFAFFNALAARVPALTVPADKLPERVNDPVFGALGFTQEMLPDWKKPLGKPNVAYTFFERTTFTPEAVENARKYFDCIMTGSKYCTDALKQYGIPATTLHQGVDRDTFHPQPQHHRLFRHYFTIFSGGKFEFRKGQDLVIRAVKVMQERHRDVVLVGAWHNYLKPADVAMAESKYVTLPPGPAERGEYRPYVSKLMEANGLDMNRVILIGCRAQETMAAIYHETDLGVFPSRCESGTNLVMMEYMACGKPAIASWSSGHRDILTDQNSMIIRASKPVAIKDEQNPPYTWDDPDLDELIDKLEWAYQHRDAIRAIGTRASADMERYTWARMAEELLARLTGKKSLVD